MIRSQFHKLASASFSSHSFKQMQAPRGITSKTDLFNCIHLSISNEVNASHFQHYIAALTTSLEDSHRNTQSKQSATPNAVWVNLNLDTIGLASSLCKHGYKIYKGLDTSITMYKWVSTRPMMIPPFTNFSLSCGAAVIRDQSILLVQEKDGPRKGEYGIPGGRADIGEFLSTCAERQLWEETGVRAKYKCLLYIREFPITPKGEMDIYFACLMCDADLSAIKICADELSDFKWVPLQQYRSFAVQNSWGTQRFVGQYISSLYERGFDFQKGKHPATVSYEYSSPRDHLTRTILEHQLV